MATPAAILSILVKSEGMRVLSGELAGLDATAKKTSASLDRAGVAAAGMGKATGGAATDIEKHSVRASKGYDRISTAAKFGGLAVAGIGAAAVNAAGTFEQGMNVLQSVSRASGADMKRLSKLAVQLGADTRLPGTSAQDAAQAMTEMIKAGVSLKDTMAGVRGVLVLSAAAGVDNARAAEIASNALNAFKLSGKDVGMVVDQLANTANASSVEINDVADSFKMAAAVFSGFQAPTLGAKKAMTELNVAIGLLGNAGIKGSDAGTSLKQMLLQLTGPSNKAKSAMQALYLVARGATVQESTLTNVIQGGTKQRETALNSIVAHNKALADGGDIAYDASGKMRSLKDIIALVTAGTKSMTDEEKNAYVTQIFGADATRSVIALMNAGPAAFDKMTAAVTRQGAAQDLADAKMKGFKGALEAFKSAAETAAISLGTVLLPAATAAARAFAGLATAMGAHKTIALVSIGVLGTLAAAVLGVNAAVAAWSALQTIAMAATKAWTGAMLLLDAALAANPILLVVVALAALGAALVIAYQRSETFRTAVTAMFEWLRGASATIGQVASAAPQAIAAAWHAATAAVVGEISQWNLLWSAIGRGAGIMVAIVKAQLAVLTVAFRVAMFALAPIATAAWKLVQGIFSAAWAAIKGIVTGGLTAVRGVILVFGGLLKGDFGQMWDGVKTIFRGAIKALAGILDGAWKIMKAPVDAIGAGLHDAFAHSWDRIKSVFESSINAVIDFLNVLIKAVNAIPGVPDIKPIGNIGGGGGGGRQKQQNLGQTGHLARGGAFRRTKGIVNQPITLMGEEAPTYPEFVIPTNPAYRKRAQGLLGQAAGAIGMAQGGVWSKGELMSLWRQVNDGLGDANLMAAIALAESGGRQSIVNSIGAGGLWQIYPPEPGYLDPKTNAEIAGRKLRTQGLQAWVAYTNGAYKQFMGGKGILDKVGGLLSGGIDSILGAFPKVNDAMGIFKGLGSYVLGKATAWAKDKVGNLFSTGGGGQGLVAKGPKGVGSFMGVPMANWVIESLQYAQSKGVTVRPTSGYRPGFDPHTASGRSEHQGTQYPHGAVDFGGYNTGGAMKRAVTAATASFKYPLLNPIGFHDEGHASGTGHAMGGIFSYLGSFRDGGITDKTGMALLHANEAVLPLASGGMTGTRGIVTTRNNTTSLASALGKFRPPTDARGRPLRPGQIPRGFGDPGITPPAAAAPADEGGISAAEQAMLDAIAAQTAAMEENTRIQNLVHDQQDIITANQNKILAMAGQGDRILAAVVAAVNGGIGGKAGLGFQSVSYSGGMARYK